MHHHLFMTELVQPVLIKDGGLFLVSAGDGEVKQACGSGLGLFHRDTRYLSRCEILIGGKPTVTLMTSAARGVQSVHQLTNDKIQQLDGAPLDLQSLGVTFTRTVDGADLSLTDRFDIRSFAPGPVSFRLSVLVDALFEDIFELRGAEPGQRGPLRKVRATGDSLTFRYAGADGIDRQLNIGLSRPAAIHAARSARILDFDIQLESQATETLTLRYEVTEAGEPRPATPVQPGFYAGVSIESDNADLDQIARRSFRDLELLATPLETTFIAGGMPWFVAPFGRDSILAALQTLAFDPRPAEGVARLFAAYQGTRTVAETWEQPGKIPHELRLGAMARLKEVPHRPSYMSIDATPLFLILVGEHARWTGSPRLLEELRPAVDAALAWMDTDGDSDGDGYLDYTGETADGLINQGWKDSNAGVPRKDGSTPRPPIALCEVQGYAYLARRLIADALRAAGATDEAGALDAAADALRARFNRDFWMEDEGCFALALEKGGRQVTVITSNAGQVLWSGIADEDKSRRTADRLMREDMFCGWGVRTLSEREATYNPLNYHLGCVWPFDNALIAAGLLRYGLDHAATELFGGVLAAGRHFSLGRLPEFYVGFRREPDLFPARCPFAEPMQAWSAGAVPYMLAAMLGLRRDGDGLEAANPRLPPGVSWLTVRGVTLGAARFDCAVTRSADGTISAAITEAGSPIR